MFAWELRSQLLLRRQGSQKDQRSCRSGPLTDTDLPYRLFVQTRLGEKGPRTGESNRSEHETGVRNPGNLVRGFRVGFARLIWPRCAGWFPSVVATRLGSFAFRLRNLVGHDPRNHLGIPGWFRCRFPLSLQPRPGVCFNDSFHCFGSTPDITAAPGYIRTYVLKRGNNITQRTNSGNTPTHPLRNNGGVDNTFSVRSRCQRAKIPK